MEKELIDKVIDGLIIFYAALVIAIGAFLIIVLTKI
jgi:hypothetical protein